MYNMHTMKTTNVSTFRAHLSRFLAAVRRGETVEIRDRKNPIARLVPVEPMTAAGREGIPPWLLKLAEEGVVKLGPMKGVPEIMKSLPKARSGASVLEALLEERRTGR